MKNGSTKRTISRVLAFVMLVSAMFTNMISANADVLGVSGADDVISAASAVVDDIVDSDVEDLAAVPADVAAATQILSYEEAKLGADHDAFESANESTKAFFKVVGKVENRVSSSGKNNGIEILKADQGSIQFTVDTASDVLLYLGSTGSDKESAWSIEDVNTASVKGSGVVAGTAKDVLTWSGNVPAGTYKVYSPLDTTRDRGVRVYYIGVTPAAGGTEPDPETSTAAPVVEPGPETSTAAPVEPGPSTGGEGGKVDELDYTPAAGFYFSSELANAPVEVGTSNVVVALGGNGKLQKYTGDVTLDVVLNYSAIKGDGEAFSVQYVKADATDPSKDKVPTELGGYDKFYFDADGGLHFGSKTGTPVNGTMIAGDNNISIRVKTVNPVAKAADENNATVTINGETTELTFASTSVGGFKVNGKSTRTAAIKSLSAKINGSGTVVDPVPETSTAAPVVDPDSETSTAAPVVEGTAKVNVVADKTEVKAGEEVKVSFNIEGLSNTNGFNNYTAFITYDPAVLMPKEGGFADGGMVLKDAIEDAAGNKHDAYACNVTNFNNQLKDVPEAGDSDYGDAADGILTQAQLGKIKVVDCVFSNNDFVIADPVDGTVLPAFKEDGTLFTLTFTAVAAGATDVDINFASLNTVNSKLEEVAYLEPAVTKTNVTVTGEETQPTTDDSYTYVAKTEDSFKPGEEIAHSEGGAVVNALVQIDGKDDGDAPVVIKDDAVNTSTPDAAVPGSQKVYYSAIKGAQVELSSSDFVPGLDENLFLGKNPYKDDPTKGTNGFRKVLEVKAADKDVEFTIDHVMGDGKLAFIFLLDENGKVCDVLYGENNNSGGKLHRTAKVVVPAGKTAMLSGQGTNMEIYAINLKDIDNGAPSSKYSYVAKTEDSFAPDTNILTGAGGSTVKALVQMDGKDDGDAPVVIKDDAVYTSTPDAAVPGSQNVYYSAIKGAQVELSSSDFVPGLDENLFLGKNPYKDDPTKGTNGFRKVLEISAPADKDVEFTIDHVMGDGKLAFIFLLDENGKVCDVLYGENNNSGGKLHRTAKVTVPAGKKAMVSGQGTNMEIYGFTIEEKDTQTPPPPSDLTLVGAKATVTADAAKAGVPVTFKLTNVKSPVSNYVVIVKYDPSKIMATSASILGDYNKDLSNADDQLKYVPAAADPDYQGLADGKKTAAEIGIVKVAAVYNAPISADTDVLSITFTAADPKEKDVYPISIESVAVGNGTTIVDCAKDNGSITISASGTTPTEPPTEPGTTTPTTTPSTPSRPSSGGGGGGHRRVTTTTEAAPEATTEKAPEGVTKDVDGNIVNINPPTEQKPFDGFIDIDDYGWAQDAINRLASLGIITGIGDRMFGPALPCRRCDFAILINKALGLSVSATPKNFYDNVDTSKYYYNDVLIGYNAGILSGYGNNYFKPEQYCTREEMFVLVAKTLEYLGEDVTSTSQDVLNKYTDVADISWWSAPYCAFLTDAGIVTGTPGGYAEPDRFINRAEMAVMINKDYDYALEVLARQMKSGSQANSELLDEAAEGSDAAEATTVEGATEETTEATEEATEADAEATTAEAETEVTTEAAAE